MVRRLQKETERNTSNGNGKQMTKSMSKKNKLFKQSFILHRANAKPENKSHTQLPVRNKRNDAIGNDNIERLAKHRIKRVAQRNGTS